MWPVPSQLHAGADTPNINVALQRNTRMRVKVLLLLMMKKDYQKIKWLRASTFHPAGVANQL